MKSFIDNLVVARDKIEDTPKNAAINHSGVVNNWIIIVFLSIAYLLLLVAFLVRYYIKHGFTILCL